MTTTAGPRSRARWVVLPALFALLLASAAGLAFLCDDAFITFRYVSNAMDGRGLVWNPAPFSPVEGYTGFSWAMLLWGVWRLFGVEPPDAANVLSIGCGLLTFAAVAVAALRLRGRDGRRLPDTVGLVALAAIAGNRTFAQWMTSGLETSLFVLATVGWVLLAFRRERGSARWLAAWSGCAAASALTRPDGLVLVGITAAVALLQAARRRRPWRRCAIGLLPVLAVVAHLGWRHSFYGEWVPNTYFAKVGDPWPEAGLRYLALFLAENGGVVFVPLAVWWLLTELRYGPRRFAGWLVEHVEATSAVAAMFSLVGYYVVVVGGDHFEFRVLSHLVPLGGLAVAAMGARSRAGAASPLAAVAALGLTSTVAWLVPLVQPPTTFLYQPLATHVPAWIAPLARWYDRQRAWLSLQAVDVRCAQHRAFLASETARLPERTRTGWREDDVPVLVADCVGRVGWVLPDVAIVDRLGLNDWVAARWSRRSSANEPEATPLERVLAAADADHDGRITLAEVDVAAKARAGTDVVGVSLLAPTVFTMFGDADGTLAVASLAGVRRFFAGLRRMAHDRQAPADYVGALAPNATVVDRRLQVEPRATPLDGDRIRAIEAEWRARVRARTGS